jgi:hypothetical protein
MAAQDFGKIGLADARQFGCSRLRELATLNEPPQFNHHCGLEQHLLRIGQAQVSKDVVASDFDFWPALRHGTVLADFA